MNIEYLDSVDSTNAYCMRELNQLDSETLVVAKEQTDGRGRNGRSWHSPKGKNFYGSFVIKPSFGGAQLFTFPMVAALAIKDTVATFGVNGTWIKWPNDIWVDDKKLAGVLIESHMNAAEKECIIVGLGVNLNMKDKDLKEIDVPATSISKEIKTPVELEAYAEAIYRLFIYWYRQAQDGQLDAIYHSWGNRNPLVNKNVVLVTGEERIPGRVVQLHRDGSLELEKEDGSRQIFHAGDISLKLDD